MRPTNAPAVRHCIRNVRGGCRIELDEQFPGGSTLEPSRQRSASDGESVQLFEHVHGLLCETEHSAGGAPTVHFPQGVFDRTQVRGFTVDDLHAESGSVRRCFRGAQHLGKRRSR